MARKLPRTRAYKALYEQLDKLGVAGAESGQAGCALIMLEDALRDVRKGDYNGFLVAASLAGDFARKARHLMYERRHAAE